MKIFCYQHSKFNNFGKKYFS